MREEDILYETGKFWIIRNARRDFEINQDGSIVARRRALIGKSFGLEHAKEYADKLKQEMEAAPPPIRLIKRGKPYRPAPRPAPAPVDDAQGELF